MNKNILDETLEKTSANSKTSQRDPEISQKYFQEEDWLVRSQNFACKWKLNYNKTYLCNKIVKKYFRFGFHDTFMETNIQIGNSI